MNLPVVFNNRYQLHTRLGEGGLAVVYLAKDLALGRSVAVKLLRTEYTTDPTFLVRFHREAQSAAALNNSNTVSVYDFGQDHGRPYIVMEYVAGDDLRTVLNRGLLTVAQAVEYGIQICNAVGMAHRRGMVHGDMKPGNILISPENRAKVTDFGLARALGDSAMDDGEVVWGTPAYFAPEQAAGDRVMPATDVYAIGIILYEMLTGTVPFKGENDQEVARKQLYEHPAPMSAHTTHPIPAELEKIVRRAMQKEPTQRYRAADELRDALLYFQQSLGNSYTQNIPTWQGQSTAQKSPTDWLGLTLGALAVLAIVGLIPLWVKVYRLHFRATPVPESNLIATPFPTPALNQSRVPLLVGFSQKEAESILNGIALNMTVNGYEIDPNIEAFSVVKQSIPAGMPIQRGTTVYVTLSRGQNLVNVPSVVGFQLQEAKDQLSALKLHTKVVEIWSLEPNGTVLEQSPGNESLLSEDSSVTLSVSGGTKISTNANFDHQIILTAFELPQILYNHNETIPLTLHWQADQSPRQNYDVLIQLTKLNGDVVAEYQSNPVRGSKPTLSWLTSQQIVDAYQLIIPASLASGPYQIRLSWVKPENKEKLTVISSDLLEKEGGTLILQEIRVN